MTVRIHPKYVGRDDHVWVWDIGPQQPEQPKVPVPPVESKDLKGADLALAVLHYEDAMEDYKLDLRAYGKAKVDYTAWRREFGGPVKVSMWSTDAVHALTIAPERYFLDLPKGQKPGRMQLEADEAAAMSEAELQEAREKDPQFGKGLSR